MILENIKENENIKPNSREIEKLKGVLPCLFDKDGNFSFDRLKKMLKESNITINKEGYELNFLGKSYARYLSSTKTETFISPHTEENEKEENKNSENMYIIGDNLDALKHLLGSYTGKIKCIYIDPPYNTGSDGFVYNDNFYFDEKKLSEMLGVEEEEAQRIIDLKGKSSHSAWLTFMYPRLILARELLSDDGVIFISIDDNEQANLKLICDEIFGEENLISFTLRKTVSHIRKNSDNELQNIHDYIYIYAKNKENTKLNKINKGTIQYDFEDEKGKYTIKSFQNSGADGTREARPNLYYSIFFDEKNNIFSLTKKENCIEILPKKVKGQDGRWLWSREKFENDKELLMFKNNTIYRKSYYNEDENQEILENHKAYLDIFQNNLGAKMLSNLGMNNVFNYSKPMELLKFLIDLIYDIKDSIVLDFFSGSATTAHAVMQLNAENAQKSGGGA